MWKETALAACLNNVNFCKKNRSVLELNKYLATNN